MVVVRQKPRNAGGCETKDGSYGARRLAAGLGGLVGLAGLAAMRGGGTGNPWRGDVRERDDDVEFEA